jgi:hypothetical protein
MIITILGAAHTIVSETSNMTFMKGDELIIAFGLMRSYLTRSVVYVNNSVIQSQGFEQLIHRRGCTCGRLIDRHDVNRRDSHD